MQRILRGCDAGRNRDRSLHLAFTLSLLLPLGCTTQIATSDCYLELQGVSLEAIPEVDPNLRDGVASYLNALFRCRFPPELARQVPEVKRLLEAAGGARLDECLCYRVTQATVEGDGLVSIQLLPQGVPRDHEYVVFARFIDPQWTFSWPRALGPPLN